MANYEIAPSAQRDISAILEWTSSHFGESSRLRYETLLIRAIHDVAENPARLGSMPRPEFAAGAVTYHLWHSRNRAGPRSERVKHPRHFLLYRVRRDGWIEIGRVLHESMDVERHVWAD